MKLYDQESYFTTGEFACKCDCGFGSVESDISPKLIEKLNIIRTLYGKPMVVTSGARCEEYNASIGGKKKSAHLPHFWTGQCRAVDIKVTSSYDRFKLLDLALKIGFKRIGLAKTFIHLDVAWDLDEPVIFNY
jgi:uncharacterized protein YcbK (DUF882 family)